VVGRSGGAYRWQRGATVQRLGKAVDAFAYGVNNDGSVVVGQVQTKKGLDGFVWESKNGFTIVPNCPLMAVSPDGHSACGIQTVKGGVQAVDWHDGLAQPLPVPAGTSDSSAFAISQDGQRIVGAITIANATTGCIWENETYRLLSNLGSMDTTARCITYDGSFIGGYVGDEAAIWTADGKGQKLSNFLTRAGVGVKGWNFESVTGIARTGRNLYITGWAHYLGKEAGFWATVNVQ
jgi:uncharacterized membrane protein